MKAQAITLALFSVLSQVALSIAIMKIVFKDLEFVSLFYDFLSKALYFLEIDYNNVMSENKIF